MKNTLLLLGFVALTLASCKKEYPCECKYTSTYAGVQPGTSLNNTPKMKKEHAIQKCNEGDGTFSYVYFDPLTNQVVPYSITTECELK